MGSCIINILAKWEWCTSKGVKDQRKLITGELLSVQLLALGKFLTKWKNI